MEYIGSHDCTITGSRTGHAVIFMKYMVNYKGKDGFEKDVLQCLENAEYLLDQVEKHLPHYEAYRNQNSITVVLKKPSDIIIQKWQLAVQDDLCHVITMPHVTKEVIQHFMADLIKENLRVSQ